MAAGDNAVYHNSNKTTGYIEGNPGRLRRMATLPYAPNYNAAEPPIRAVKAALSNVGADSAGTISGELRRCIKSGLIDPVKLCDYAACRGSIHAGQRPSKKIAPGEHIACAQKKMPDREKSISRRRALGKRQESTPTPRKGAQCRPPSCPTRTFRPAFLQGFRRCCLRSRWEEGGGGGERQVSCSFSPPPLRAAPHAAPAVCAASGRFLQLNRAVQPLRLRRARFSTHIDTLNAFGENSKTPRAA